MILDIPWQWISFTSNVSALRNEMNYKNTMPLQWHHNGHDSGSNHQPHDGLLNSLFRRRSKKTSKLRITVLCAGNSPGTSEFPAQMASNEENVSILWHHHALPLEHHKFSPEYAQNRHPITHPWGCGVSDVLRDFKLWYIDGLDQDCSNSSALAMELLQSCTKPSIYQ